MSLECLNGTVRFDNATLQSVEATQSVISWFIGSCAMSASLVANGWLLAVSWGSTHIDGIFKYPVCYLAFCDVLVSVIRISQLTFQLLVDASTYLRYCAVCYGLLVAGGNAMLLALIPTPLQRCLMFIEVPSLSDHARQPRSILVFCAATFILSVVPPIGSILAPADRCLNKAQCLQLPVNGLLHAVALFAPAMSYVGAAVAVSAFVWKVKEMNTLTEQLDAAANVEQSSAEVNLNSDILAMAVVQTFNPLLLTAPTVLIGVGQLFGFTPYMWFLLLGAGVFQLNPLVDALSTIYFIKPYRRLALKTEKQIRQILGKPSVVNPTPAVVLSVAPANEAGPSNDYRVTFTTPAPPI